MRVAYRVTASDYFFKISPTILYFLPMQIMVIKTIAWSIKNDERACNVLDVNFSTRTV